MLNLRRSSVLLAVLALALSAPAMAYDNFVAYNAQGMTADGFGGYDLTTELCGIANGADVDGPYILWVLTATGANNADITGPWGTATMFKVGNGTFKYISAWWDPSTLFPGTVTASYDSKAKNAQLTVSHGCRPFTHGAWCSPGFWRNAEDAAWTLTGHGKTELFNDTVVSGLYGSALGSNPTLFTVLSTSGGTYKGAGVAGTDPRVQSPNPALNAFNAVGAYLTDQIPGYQFDPEMVTLESNFSDTCPIDHHGNLKLVLPSRDRN